MTGLAVLGQTIQVVDKSGKVVSTSRHLFDVFKIGRDAYNERKKEINAKKAPNATAESAKVRQRPTGRAYTIDDAESIRSGRSHRSHRSHHSHRPHHHHEHSRGAEATNPAPEGVRSPEAPRSPGEDIPAGTPFYQAFPEMAPPPRRHSTFHGRPGPPPHSNSSPANPHTAPPPQPQWYYEPAPNQPPQYGQPPFPGQHPQMPPPRAPSRAPTTMVRRSTTKGKPSTSRQRPEAGRRRSSYSGVDMDLAYGPLPPDLLYPGSPSVASTPAQDEETLKGLIGKANFLLDEAQCLRQGATATIAHLQKSPDAMAAVGLTLAEISNLAKKMGPQVLKNLKTLSPAVFGLLSHPHFLIAAGVATGVTIIAFGGYKIVKRIQERKEMEAVGDEGMLPVEDVSRIETWRRGIAEVETVSDGTSVEGEFMTPMARNLSRLNLAEEKRERARSGVGEKSARTKASSAPKSVVSTRSKRSSSEPAKARKSSTSGAKSTTTKTTSKPRPDGYVREKERKPRAKEPKPSPLRHLLLA